MIYLEHDFACSLHVFSVFWSGEDDQKLLGKIFVFLIITFFQNDKGDKPKLKRKKAGTVHELSENDESEMSDSGASEPDMTECPEEVMRHYIIIVL